MRQTRLKKFFRQSVMWLSLITLISTIFLVTSSGIASAHTLASATVPPPCRHALNANYSISCVLPTITTAPQSQCPGTQYHGTLDSYKIPVNTTLTDQGNTCVNVTYHFSPNFSSCTIFFYIPAGSIATAVFSYGGSQSGTIDENNSLAGWKMLYSSSSANSLTFTDHDTPGNRNLSWGSTVSYSLEVFCS